MKSSEQVIDAWEYDEAELTLEEYAEYQKEMEEMQSLPYKANQENTEIMMEAMADSYVQQMVTQENQIIIMEAIADIYNILAEGGANT